MATRMLVAYHSEEGQTAKVAERIVDRLRAGGLSVDGVELEMAPAPVGYDVVVLGDSIHAGRHSRALRRYIGINGPELAQRPAALFQVSLTSASHDDEHDAVAAGLAEALSRDTGLQPAAVGLFAGALRYSRYGRVKRTMMRSIARHDGRDDDTSRDHEYTDWDAVDRFADTVAALVA